MKWITADEHYHHSNILLYERRPFKSIEHMNKAIIKNNNMLVDTDDDVYHVGDFSLRTAQYLHWYSDVVSSLKGRHHLILGNHDDLHPWQYIKAGFVSVHTSLEVDDFILVHDPSASIIDKDRIFLCGHVHSLFEEIRNVINVGVDVRKFRPISMDDVSKIAERL
jgi:calcineurin-like phosphoesterase family protein